MSFKCFIKSTMAVALCSYLLLISEKKINNCDIIRVTMMSLRSALSSMSRMTRQVSTGSQGMAIHQVQSKEEFQQKEVDGEKPTLVDFSAIWADPSKLLVPGLDDAIASEEDKVDLVNVDS